MKRLIVIVGSAATSTMTTAKTERGYWRVARQLVGGRIGHGLQRVKCRVIDPEEKGCDPIIFEDVRDIVC